METRAHSALFEQNKKFYTYLPLLLLPFLTLAYWAVGIKMIYKNQVAQNEPQGLNTSLPDPKLKDETAFSKLTYYKKATDDSAKIREQLKKDPYRSAELASRDELAEGLTIQGLGAPQDLKQKAKTVSYKGKTYGQGRQTDIISKLKSLDSVLAQSTQPQFAEPAERPLSSDDYLAKKQSLIRSLEIQQNTAQGDPELLELNGMLEKILDIQHPDRVAQRTRQQSAQLPSFAVTAAADQTPVADFGADSTGDPVSQISFQANGFFSLDDAVSGSTDNAIKAVVHEQQTLVTGSSIKLRLATDIYVQRVLIPKDSFVYGTVSVNGERLMVDISSIRLNSSLFPVRLSVYDMDGQAGIYIPGSISRNVAKQSVSQDIQGLSVGTLDPSIGAQVAGAGIQAAKTLLGRKARLVQVSVKAGYQILLKDAGQKAI
ncbi:conjugative transposon protein TraM [Dyadobacter luteus]|uniref:Conjugative transposon protein TraM n=1 Tax=Dyadobacter luteus TaxID=2259619 RepID=A0A3D8YAE5_9BACT|nr:conjugative transposon protein TraM [Dyadobacter luteus]REA60060.1 conjugative transposon protein TraM [Dyadobacter luteus]